MPLLLFLATLAGCDRTQGDLTIHGDPVDLAGCLRVDEAGRADGTLAPAIDLVLQDGRALRLFGDDAGIVEVGFFPDPEDVLGFLVGDCATGEIIETRQEVQERRLYRGEATLACDQPLPLAGTVSFGGCR